LAGREDSVANFDRFVPDFLECPDEEEEEEGRLEV
jgi:hypothetical protein